MECSVHHMRAREGDREKLQKLSSFCLAASLNEDERVFSE